MHCLLSLLVVIGCGLTKAAYLELGTVYEDNNGSLKFVAGKADKAGLAYGSLEYSVQENGWAELNIAAGSPNGSVRDELLLKAAGFLEGALTKDMIHDHYVNMYNWTFNGRSEHFITVVKDWFAAQRSWVTSNLPHANSSDIWYYMNLLTAQFQGLYEGYNSEADPAKTLDLFAFDLLNGNGDMLDLLTALDPNGAPDFDAMTKKEIFEWVSTRSHCSVLIKLLPGYENLFFGHSSWFTYASMLRIYKHYHFQLQDSRAAAKRVSFSSYPAYLSSLDDFYLMDSGLAMLQTTNGVFNTSIYSKVTHDALLAWQRVRVANWLATGGREWSYYVSQYNSGTYNNQYMVLDLKLMQLKENVADNALWVVEQLPGLMVSADQTQLFRNGYWASYNVPFYEVVFEMSGYAEMVEKHGPDFSHQLAVRAKIFRRDEGKVVDMQSYQHLMLYNDYTTDSYSEGDPMNAICSRGDLEPNPSSGGCTDSKVTDYAMAMEMKALIKNGPTSQDLPPFQWSKSPFTIPHEGQPDMFDFDYVLAAPRT